MKPSLNAKKKPSVRLGTFSGMGERIVRNTQSKQVHYQYNSTPRKFHAGYLPKTLQKSS